MCEAIKQFDALLHNHQRQQYIVTSSCLHSCMVRVFFLTSPYFQGRNHGHENNLLMPSKISNYRNVTLITKSAFMRYFTLSLEDRKRKCVMNQSTTFYHIFLKNHQRALFSHVFPHSFLEKNNVEFSTICTWISTLQNIESSDNLITEYFY